MTYLLIAVAAILAWLYFRPQWDWSDWSFSTRGWNFRQPYWRNGWLSWFAFKCVLCGTWGGCGEPGHRFCGLCPACKESNETDRVELLRPAPTKPPF